MSKQPLDYNSLKKHGWKITFRHWRRYVEPPFGQKRMDQSKRLSHLGGSTLCKVTIPAGIFAGGPHTAMAEHICPDTARFNKKQNNKKAFYKVLHLCGYLEELKNGNHL